MPIWTAATESHAIIDNRDLHVVINPPDLEPDLIGPRMLSDIMQSLPDDANHGPFDVGSQPDTGNFIDVEFEAWRSRGHFGDKGSQGARGAGGGLLLSAE